MKVRTTSLVVLGLALALVLMAGLRPVGFDRDSLNYAAILGTDFGGVLFGAREPTFWLIDRISQVIPGDHVTNFFLIYALLGVALNSLSLLDIRSYPYSASLSMWRFTLLVMK